MAKNEDQTLSEPTISPVVVTIGDTERGRTFEDVANAIIISREEYSRDEADNELRRIVTDVRIEQDWKAV